MPLDSMGAAAEEHSRIAKADNMLKAINEKGQVSIESKLSPEKMDEVMDAYFDVLALPQEVKNHLVVYHDNGEWDNDNGYIKKERKIVDGKMVGDDKEYFHFRPIPRVRSMFQAVLANPNVSDEHKAVIKKYWDLAEEVYADGMASIRETYNLFGEVYPGFKGKYDEDKEHTSVNRYIGYEAPTDLEEGGISAVEHIDKSDGTTPLKENADGLEVANGLDEGYEAIPHTRKIPAILFKGPNMMKNVPYPYCLDFMASWHRVRYVKTPESDQNLEKTKKYTRGSIILFLSNKDNDEPTEYQTHTPELYVDFFHEQVWKKIDEQFILGSGEDFRQLDDEAVEVLTGSTWTDWVAFLEQPEFENYVYGQKFEYMTKEMGIDPWLARAIITRKDEINFGKK